MTTSTTASDRRRIGETEGSDGGDRLVVTLSPAVATAVRRMAEQIGGVGTTEVVRRGLMLLDLYLSLPDNEEMVIRDRASGVLERFRMGWDSF